MGIKNIIKDSLLNEIGDAGKTPFRFKKNTGYSTPYEHRKEKDVFNYEFKTKEGFVYDVSIQREMNRETWGSTPTEKEWREELAQMYGYDRKKYINLKKIGATRDDLKTMWGVGFSISDSPRTEETYTANTYTSYTRYGDVDMDSPVDDTPKIYTIQSRTHSGYDEPNKGEFFRVMSTIVKIVKNHFEKHGGRILMFTPYDERRARVFTHFIMKQIPGSKVWVEDNEFYFLLNL
jgi:hypothetical protein